MKRLVPLLVLFALAFGSLGKGQSDGFGIYSGWPTWIGAQFQTDGLRAGVGFSAFGFGADLGLIIAESRLAAAPDLDLSWYYGAGAGLGIWTFRAASGIYIFPHGLIGLEWQLPQADFSLYSEIQAGLGLYLGDLATAFGTNLRPDFAGRVGIIFRR